MRRFGERVVEQEQEERGDRHLAKQIAVGILIAAAVIFVGLHVYAYMVVRAAEEAMAAFAQQAQQELVQQRAANRAKAERKATAELERRQELARETQAAADQAKLEQANAAAKQRAWQQFYRAPMKCQSPPDWDTQVECGNAHIKAKREFEDPWSRGEI